MIPIICFDSFQAICYTNPMLRLMIIICLALQGVTWAGLGWAEEAKAVKAAPPQSGPEILCPTDYMDAKYSVDQNYESAFTQCKEEAAESNNPFSQFILAYMYEKGQGVREDFGKAFYWYKKASDQGNTDATTALAALYSEGRGVKQDKKLALALFHKAALQHNPLAQRNLGAWYYNEYNLVESYKWYALAAAQNFSPALEEMRVVGARMTSDEVKRATEAAVEWQKLHLPLNTPYLQLPTQDK